VPVDDSTPSSPHGPVDSGMAHHQTNKGRRPGRASGVDGSNLSGFKTRDLSPSMWSSQRLLAHRQPHLQRELGIGLAGPTRQFGQDQFEEAVDVGGCAHRDRGRSNSSWSTTLPEPTRKAFEGRVIDRRVG